MQMPNHQGRAKFKNGTDNPSFIEAGDVFASLCEWAPPPRSASQPFLSSSWASFCSHVVPCRKIRSEVSPGCLQHHRRAAGTALSLEQPTDSP